MKSNIIKIINDDIFATSAGVIVVPRSTTGTLTGVFRSGLKKLGVDLSPKLEYRALGSIDPMSVHNVSKSQNLILILATSVDNDTSSLQAITEIVTQLSRFTINNTHVREIAIPLLGTGAGGLRHVDVFKIYHEVFTNKANASCSFYVYIPEEIVYEKVKKYEQAIPKIVSLETSTNNPKDQVINKSGFPNFKQKANETTNDESSNQHEIFTATRLVIRDKNNIEPVLGVSELASKTADILRKINATEQGNMIGIFGRWGRGKSFFINELWKELANTPKHKKVDFHAWKYQDTPACWAYLYEKFSEAYFADAKNWFFRMKRRFHLNFIRLGSFKLVFFILILSISVGFSFGVPFEEKIKLGLKIITLLGGVIALIKLIYFYYHYGGTAKNLFNEYYTKISFSKYLGTQAEVQKELIFLLNAWCGKNNGNKIFLFVEDIDRCPEQRVIDIVDSLRVMLEDSIICKHVIIVAAIDERILHNAIKLKYNQLFSEDTNANVWSELSSEYFDKLFMLGLKLGDLSSGERDEYFVQLTKDDRQKLEVSQYINPLRVGNTTTDKKTKSKKDLFVSNDVLGSSNTLNDNKETTVDKLTPGEIEMLRKVLRDNSHMTPRQIRIFYYRYILVKHILEIEYSRIQQQNSWFYSDRCEIMARLLFAYSKSDNKNKLNEHKRKALEMTSATMKVELIPNTVMETNDYCNLLRVLDIVVAY